MSVPTSFTLDSLPSGVRSFVDKWSEHCTPEGVHVCDGSDEEDRALLQLLVEKGSITPLSKLENWCVYKSPGTMYQRAMLFQACCSRQSPWGCSTLVNLPL